MFLSQIALAGAMVITPLAAPEPIPDVLPQPHLVSGKLVPAKFCDGIRTARQQYGWTYKAFHDEFALNLDDANGIEKEGIKMSLASGASPENAAIKGAKMKADAKKAMAKIHSTYTKEGQVSLCGKVSGNW